MFFALQNRRRSIARRTILLALLTSFTFSDLVAADLTTTDLAATDSCMTVDLAAGDTWRSPGPGETATCFSLIVPQRGHLAVELISPVDGPETHLALHCSSTLPWAKRLSHTPSHLLMDAVPGVYKLRVRSVDPEAVMPTFRLQSRFLPGAPTKGEDDHELEIEVDPLLAATCLEDPTKGEDDHELEIEVDPFLMPVTPPTKGEDDHELEIEVDPLMASCQAPTKGEDDHELEIEVDPMVAYADTLCELEAGDDHDDGSFCASQLDLIPEGIQAHGELANAWGDDQDAYTFTLDRPATVRLGIDALPGSISTALYDADGQRVHHGARGMGAHRLDDGWVRRLKAGTYHLRVDGDHGTSYALELKQLR